MPCSGIAVDADALEVQPSTLASRPAATRIAAAPISPSSSPWLVSRNLQTFWPSRDLDFRDLDAGRIVSPSAQEPGQEAPRLPDRPAAGSAGSR